MLNENSVPYSVSFKNSISKDPVSIPHFQEICIEATQFEATFAIQEVCLKLLTLETRNVSNLCVMVSLSQDSDSGSLTQHKVVIFNEAFQSSAPIDHLIFVPASVGKVNHVVITGEVLDGDSAMYVGNLQIQSAQPLTDFTHLLKSLNILQDNKDSSSSNMSVDASFYSCDDGDIYPNPHYDPYQQEKDESVVWEDKNEARQEEQKTDDFDVKTDLCFEERERLLLAQAKMLLSETLAEDMIEMTSLYSPIIIELLEMADACPSLIEAIYSLRGEKNKIKGLVMCHNQLCSGLVDFVGTESQFGMCNCCKKLNGEDELSFYACNSCGKTAMCSDCFQAKMEQL